jgi:hypothetical protein
MFWKIFRLCIWIIIWALTIKFLVPTNITWVGLSAMVMTTPIYIVIDSKIWKDNKN